MDTQPAEEFEKLLLLLSSKLANRRTQAAKKLINLDLNAIYPDLPPERLAELRRVVVEVASQVRDGTAIKEALSLSSLAIGYIPLVIYIVGRFLGIQLGAIFGIAAMVWLMVWYFRSLNKALHSIATRANKALEIGRESGLLKGSAPTT